MSETAKRPVPKENVFVDARPFWKGARAGKLVLQYCRDSGKFQHYPRPVSIYTGSRNLEWREVSGCGTIYACSVVRIPGPGVEGRLPLSIAIVELEEGVRMMTNIVHTEITPENLELDMPLRVVFEQRGDVHLPLFEPTDLT